MALMGARLLSNAAQLLIGAGETAEAERVLVRAHDILHPMGAGHELEVVRAALRSIGVRPRYRPDRTVGVLTRQERESAQGVSRIG